MNLRMKTLSKLTLIVLFAVASIAASAQGKAKFGHIDSQILLASMPELVSLQNEMQKYQTELEDQLTAMQKEFEAKYTEYIQNADSLSKLLKKTKEEELQLMNQRIENFQVQASQDVQQKQEELYAPIVKKAKDAISKVAKEQGLIYVFDVAEGAGGVVVLYHSEESKDIIDDVKKELGI